MAEIPTAAAKAFDELSALLGGAGSRLEDLSAQAPAVRSDIVARLSKVGAKLSPDFLGDFQAATANSQPAAVAPPASQALMLSPALSWGAVIVLGALLLWGLNVGRR